MPLKPEIKDKFVDGLAPCIAYLVQSSETTVDDQVMIELNEAVDAILEQGDVTPDQVVDGWTKVVDGITDLTPTPIDDTIVDNAAVLATNMQGVGDKLKNWIGGWFK